MDLVKLRKHYDKVNKIASERAEADYAYVKETKKYTFYLTKAGKEWTAKLKTAYRELYSFFDSQDDVWNNEKWITEIQNLNDYNSMDEARTELLNILKQYSGVSIINDKKGIKSINVKTKTKVYHYSIHAFYSRDGGYGACLYPMDSWFYRDKLVEIKQLLGEPSPDEVAYWGGA